MTHEEAPKEIADRQASVSVRFYNFDGVLQEGEIVVDRDLAKDVAELFSLILEKRFPLTSVIPMAGLPFDGDDGASMSANNTSGFNYRTKTNVGDVAEESLSNHALGRAIDINPLLNPYIKGSVVLPRRAAYDIARPGTIAVDSFIVKFLKERGWTWGGDWVSLKDYQHFEKV